MVMVCPLLISSTKELTLHYQRQASAKVDSDLRSDNISVNEAAMSYSDFHFIGLYKTGLLCLVLKQRTFA